MTLRTRAIGLFGVAAIVLSACGPGAPTTAPAGTGNPGSSTGPGATTAGSPSADLKMVLDAEPTYFSNAYSDVPTGYVVGAIYSALYRANNKLAVIPDMATDQPAVSADGLTWTVKIKDGIKFQDGSPLTADDVVFTFQLAQSPDCTFSPSWCSDMSANVKSVTASDPQTAVFTLNSKYAPFLVQDLTMPIMPKAAVMASFAKFQAAAGKADAAAVKNLDDKISTATTDKACDGSATQPSTCDFATYVADLETQLNSAGVQIVGPLNKDLFKKDDGSTDNSAYGQALYGALQDLDKSLQKTQTDQVAASFRLLDFQQHPIGSGPFMFDSYQAGQSVNLKANPSYYAGTVPAPNLFFPIIKDSASGAAAIQSNQANWLYAVVSDALPALQADSNVQVATYADFGFYAINFNIRTGHIYADHNLRQAFSECIDHDATVKQATDDQGVPIAADIPPASWAFPSNVPNYTLNVDDAKKLIESSGWTMGADGIYAKGGQRLSTTLYVRAGKTQRINFAQSAADQLKACGIEVKVNPADFATVLLPLLDYPNKFETYFGGFSTGLDPDISSLWACSQVTSKDHPSGNNYDGYCNKDVDGWITQALQTTDQATRKDLYAKAELQIHNDIPAYFTWADKGYAAVRKEVSAGTNSVVTDGTIDLTSPLYYWNFDTWTIAAS
jgi:ABC-type transport system substrate-binding protein